MKRVQIVASAIEEGFTVDDDLLGGCECSKCLLDVYIQTCICKIIGPSYEAGSDELGAVRDSLIAIAVYYQSLIKQRSNAKGRTVH